MVDIERPVIPPLLSLARLKAWAKANHLSIPRRAIVASAFVLALILLAAVAPLLPLHPNDQELSLRLAGPKEGMAAGGWEYVLGADQLGRPLLTRILFGARVSLVVGMLAPVIAMLIGIPLGLLAAEFKGKTDEVTMRVVDLCMSVPPILVALAVLYLTGPGFIKTIFVLGLMRWMVFARLTRALGMSLESTDFVEAARAAGCSRLRVMLRHILPNCRGELIIVGGLESARAILTESALSFLGLGIQPPESSWGTILAAGRNYMAVNPWIVLFSGLAILITTLSINVAVDGFNDRGQLVEYR
jgi:peptide/nickel transport system permease protein